MALLCNGGTLYFNATSETVYYKVAVGDKIYVKIDVPNSMAEWGLTAPAARVICKKPIPYGLNFKTIVPAIHIYDYSSEPLKVKLLP